MLRRFWIRIRPVVMMCFWIACIGAMMVLLGAAISHRQQLTFNAIRVNIDETNGVLFLSKEDIEGLLRDDQVNVSKSKPISEVNYGKLERIIENNPYVDNAELFVDANGTSSIQIRQRTPILRVINNQGVGYYLDEQASKMPLSSKFTARVPVATGNIMALPENSNKTDSVTQNNLYVLADYIRGDTFLTSLIEQIVVNNQHEFELIPRIGNHTILLGSTNDLSEKFSKLKVFYKEGLNRAGWNNYSQVNLKYKNEVYCKKRSTEKQVVKMAATAVNDSTMAVDLVKP